jgi:tetratricopeptide (TPR) repeat protein
MTAQLERAWLLYERSRYEMAEKEVGLALAQAPDDPQAHALMALCLLQREQFGEATEHARRAVSSAPDMPFPHYVLARVWEARNHLDEAETAVREAVRLDPSEPNYHAFLGVLRLRRSDWDGALAAGEAALALDPEHVEAVNLRAQALRRTGARQSAHAELTEALRTEPDEAATHANLGWNYLEEGDRAKAMEHFCEALRLDPEMEWARIGVLETLKSYNPLYRGLLKYFLWMQGLGERGQWGVILGAWVIYIVLRRVAAANAALAPWLTPILVGYLLFVLATWLAVPLANLTLRLHPFGRLALSREERTASNWIGGFLLVAGVAGISYWISGDNFARHVFLLFGLMLLPVGATFRCESPWPRKALVIYSLVIGAIGLVRFGLLMLPYVVDLKTVPLIVLRLAVLLLPALNLLFPLGAVLSLFAANIVTSIRWRR